MKRKNGFTLIELLAILIILSVIAVITVPLILGIIEDSKLNSITDSAYGYKSAIQNYSTYLQTIDTTNGGLMGSYTVAELKAAGLEVSGQEPNNGIILIDNQGISGCLKYDEYVSYLYNNKIINTAKGNCPTQKIVTSGQGLYKSEIEPGKLVYKGTDPNNRIFLKEDGTNNTLYRIVSYETDGTIKVVRNERISAYMAYDERDANDETTGPRHNMDNTFCNYAESYSGCNVWGNMNNTYYNGQKLNTEFTYRFYPDNSTETLQKETNEETVNTDSTLNQYLNGTWLTDALSNYIENHSFDVGGVYYYNGYTGGDKGILKEKAEEKIYTWTGKVGLLNITEYVESSANSSCTDVWSNYYFNSANEAIRANNQWPCKSDNYNYISSYNQWSLSPYSSNHYDVWHMNSSGYFNYYSSNDIHGVRPAFYLKSTINLSGTGTTGDEYVIE